MISFRNYKILEVMGNTLVIIINRSKKMLTYMYYSICEYVCVCVCVSVYMCVCVCPQLSSISTWLGKDSVLYG